MKFWNLCGFLADCRFAGRQTSTTLSTTLSGGGGRLIDVYVTLGRYDVVEIFEAPNDETAYGIVLELARHGNVRTETLRAFTRAEAEAIVRES